MDAMRQFKTKIKNAYVLIYDRQEVYDMQLTNKIIDDVRTHDKNLLQAVVESQATGIPPQIPYKVQNVILAKNRKFWLNRTIFSGDFIQKLLKIFQDIKIKEDNDFARYASGTFDL